MASLTPANIVQTSSDLSSFDISSLVGKQKIPSMYLLNELSASLSKQLDNLRSILDLNEIKWLGQSSVHPSTGRVVIDGIEYKNEDIDPGNYVTYNEPGTSSTVKYIYGHGIWTNIGDIVYLPEDYIENKHVNRNAQIALNKIAGLKFEDLQNSECNLSDVQNLSTTLKAMIADYKKFDINTIFNNISGQVNNSISIAINGNTQDLTLSFMNIFKDISGDVYNSVQTNVDTIIGQMDVNIKEQFEDIQNLVNYNTICVDRIEGEVVQVKNNIEQNITDVSNLTITNNEVINSITADVANIDNLITQKINGVINNAEFNNTISSTITAQIANVTNTIQNEIKDSVINYLDINNRIHSQVTAITADVENTIKNWVENSYVGTLTIQNMICSEVHAVSATVTNTIGTTFNNCDIGTLASYDDAFYQQVGSFTLRYCGDYPQLSDANALITKDKVCQKTYTVPQLVHVNDNGEIVPEDQDGRNMLSTVELSTDFTVHLIEKGSVVRIGNNDTGWEFYMCSYVPEVRTPANKNQIKWVPFVDNKVYIKRNNIKVDTKLPPDSQLEDGMFYVVVDE